MLHAFPVVAVGFRVRGTDLCARHATASLEPHVAIAFGPTIRNWLRNWLQSFMLECATCQQPESGELFWRQGCLKRKSEHLLPKAQIQGGAPKRGKSLNRLGK